jgi:hypothetical protein
MATNWKMNEIIDVLKNGKAEDIQDIGKRFPLTTVAVASGRFAKILGALPDYITVRKIEAVLKGEDVDTDSEIETSDDDVEDKPVEKKKRGRKAKAKVEEPEEDDAEDEDDPIALYKECKSKGLKVKARQSTEYYKKELAKFEDSDDDDGWGDEEEEKPAKKTSKKAPKTKAKKEPEPEEDEDDDDDWDI